jgi:hypothetical protein
VTVKLYRLGSNYGHTSRWPYEALLKKLLSNTKSEYMVETR